MTGLGRLVTSHVDGIKLSYDNIEWPGNVPGDEVLLSLLSTDPQCQHPILSAVLRCSQKMSLSSYKPLNIIFFIVHYCTLKYCWKNLKYVVQSVIELNIIDSELNCLTQRDQSDVLPSEKVFM